MHYLFLWHYFLGVVVYIPFSFFMKYLMLLTSKSSSRPLSEGPSILVVGTVTLHLLRFHAAVISLISQLSLSADRPQNETNGGGVMLTYT